MVSKKLKNKVIQEITTILVRKGVNSKELMLLRSKYPEIPVSKFYRWIRRIKDSGVTAKEATIRVKRKAAGRASAHDTDSAIAKEAANNLPVTVSPDDIIPSGFLNVVDQIRICMAHAEKVIKHCETDNGKIRNPKLYIQASKHILEAMKTATYISNQLMEAQRVEQFHQAILNRLKERDPIFVEEILEDLERLNQEWGVI